jgi:hypothetical protein
LIGPHDLEQRRPFIVGGAERGRHLREAAADRGAQGEGVPGARTAAAAQRFVALLQARLGRTNARLGGGQRSSRIFDTACRDRSLGQQALSTRLFSACAFERHLGLRDFSHKRRPIVGPGEARLETPQRLPGAHRGADRQERVGP